LFCFFVVVWNKASQHSHNLSLSFFFWFDKQTDRTTQIAFLGKQWIWTTWSGWQ
jgi:hypothetical protein